MSNIEHFFLENKNIINNFAASYIDEQNIPLVLKDSLKYSLINEGKKIRPLIFLVMLKYYGINYKNYIDIALSLELIHVYSLIHDDLPAMDNDDYRWSKLTNHKVFGEDIAILAGDAMQSLAYEIISSNKYLSSDIKINLINKLSNFSGAKGMIAGQIYDITQKNNLVNKDYLKNMHNLKTGRLITLPLIFSAYISNNEEDIQLLKKYGEELGIAYQIKDDILDYYGDFKIIGKKYSDINKITYLSFYGIEECENLLNIHTENAINIAKKLKNNILIDFANLLLKRNS